MVTEKLKPEWSRLAQIDAEHCLAYTLSYNGLAHFSYVYKCLEGKCVEYGSLNTPQKSRQGPGQKKLNRKSASNFPGSTTTIFHGSCDIFLFLKFKSQFKRTPFQDAEAMQENFNGVYPFIPDGFVIINPFKVANDFRMFSKNCQRVSVSFTGVPSSFCVVLFGPCTIN